MTKNPAASSRGVLCAQSLIIPNAQAACSLGFQQSKIFTSNLRTQRIILIRQLNREASMSGHIRGHYRIDSRGRVEPLLDVNASAKPYTIPLPVHRQSHVRQFSVAGVSIFVMGLSLMALLPQIERQIVSAQAAHIAMVRAAYIHNHPALQQLLKHR
jgi:hypothetical protein